MRRPRIPAASPKSRATPRSGIEIKMKINPVKNPCKLLHQIFQCINEEFQEKLAEY
jgi:hypothetical protein